jgi:DNA primase small subunit
VREQIVKYLNLSEILSDRALPPDKCPLAVQMLPRCEKHFVRVIEMQSIFTCEPLRAKVRAIIGDAWFEAVNEGLRTRRGTTREVWEAIKVLQLGNHRFQDTPAYRKLVYGFTFPRLDAHVTTTMNHLLKSPFSYHPKSGFISVPIPKAKWKRLPQTWAPGLKPLLAGDPEAVAVFAESVEIFRAFVAQTVEAGDVVSPFYD